MAQTSTGTVSLRPVLAGLLMAAAVAGGAASWFASTHPDGLEWSIARVTGKEEIRASETGVRRNLAGLQKKTAILPDYDFRSAETEAAPAEHAAPAPEPWPAVSAGTSVSGIVGGLMSLALAGLVGFALKACSIRRAH